MAVNDDFLRTTVFVGAGDRLVGTGFLVAVSAGDEASNHAFVITAGHVVRPFETTFVRVTSDGSVVDLPIDEWWQHPTHDVALANFPCNPDGLDVAFVPDEWFVDRSAHTPILGEEVFFIGLLAQMDNSSVPMVRTGTLGALDQDAVPMLEPPGTLRRLSGHLIDCRSFGGFSGAPCFMRLVRSTGRTERLGLRYPESYFVLLGMLGGHFDHRTSLKLPDGNGELAVPTSAGVGVVYPIEVLRESIEEVLAQPG